MKPGKTCKRLLAVASISLLMSSGYALAEAEKEALQGRLIQQQGGMVKIGDTLMVISRNVEVFTQDGTKLGRGLSHVPADAIVEYELDEKDSSPVPVIKSLRIEAEGW